MISVCARLLRYCETLLSTTIVGDGPERGNLEQLVKSLGIENAVSFSGWVSHDEALRRRRSADVLRCFRRSAISVQEWCLKRLQPGGVLVVADFGGPGDIVHPKVGFKVPLTNESDFVAQMEKILPRARPTIAVSSSRLRQQGMAYARERLTWDAKAEDTTRVLQWVVQGGPKPDL